MAAKRKPRKNGRGINAKWYFCEERPRRPLYRYRIVPRHCSGGGLQAEQPAAL